MSGKDLYAPKMFPFHPATAQNQRNGKIINNPIFAEMGGLSSGSKIEKSWINLESTNDTKKVVR